MEFAAPDWETLNRLRNEFLNADGNTGLYWRSPADLAQYHLYFAARIGWKWDAAIGQAIQVGWRLESPKILDWGCGTGIATLRILEACDPEMVEEVILWDHSTAATSFAQETIRATYPDLKVTIASNLPSIKWDDTLCLASHVLNELSWNEREALSNLFRRSNQVFWVEPGSYDSSRLLMEQRESLINCFNPIAPCVCAQPCPMKLEANAPHWCHFFAKPPLVAFTESNWARFSQMMEIDLRSLPYSFLTMNSKTMASRPAFSEGKSRVLGRPRQFKGFTRIYSCDEKGLNDYELWKRDDKPLWRTIKKNKAGTLFEWENVEAGKILSGKPVENRRARHEGELNRKI